MQKAILCFKDYKGKELISGISNGQNVTSHKNLNGANDFCGRGPDDRVDLLAPYDCKVVAIARADNTVLFESVGVVEVPAGYNNCWFLCTHINDGDFSKLDIRIGKVFKQGEVCYTEGTKNAYGINMDNHIHMEQGIGKWNGNSSPYYKSNDIYEYGGKKYNTYYPNVKGYELPITDVFFIPNGVEIIEGPSDVAKNYKWKKLYCTPDNIEFKGRKQYLTFKNQEIIVYKQSDDLEVGLLSADGSERYKALETIDKIDDNHVHYAKMNCSYFIMGDGQKLGVHQGLRLDIAPKDKGYLVVYVDKNDGVHWCRASEYWLTKDDVKLAFTPNSVLIYNGKEMYEQSTNLGNKYNIRNTQSLFLQCKDGKFAFAAVKGELNLKECTEFAKKYGCTFCAALDSGNSTQFISEGNKEIYTGRKIADVLCFYKKDENKPEPQPEEKPQACECEKLRKDVEGLKQQKESLIVENNNLREENIMLNNKLRRIKDLVEER